MISSSITPQIAYILQHIGNYYKLLPNNKELSSLSLATGFCRLCEQTPDPECLFSYHAGAIQGLDVSWKSHLMATTALDRE